jgi:hypothetical protein
MWKSGDISLAHLKEEFGLAKAKAKAVPSKSTTESLLF